MAEFQKVMREWVRARKAINQNQLTRYPLETFTDDYIANIEKEVMSWAAEHPEPVYPSWEKWLIGQGVIRENPIGVGNPLPKLLEPIPADIAEKLGIEPKEGT